MKGKPGNGGELENKDLIPRVKPPLVGNTAKNEANSISNRGGVEEMGEKVSVVYEGTSDNLQAAYRLLAEFFKEYLDESGKEQKAEGGDIH